MVNFYTQFKTFIKVKKLKQGGVYPLEEFEQKMKSFYGLSKNKTIDSWLNNFHNEKLINITKKGLEDNNIIWVVKILKQKEVKNE